ncbi:MAG TPA: hypothetical protein VGY56_02540 [Verrucomicrobiae bacterium]|nr:hypothetical protein [Verrucomicrobiae bacterium]
MKYELSKEAAQRAVVEFDRALNTALPPYELHKLGRFSPEEEAFIQKEVQRLLYEPQLPNAGDSERRIVKRLKSMADARFWKNSEAAASWVVDDEKKKTIGWLQSKAALAADLWAQILPNNPKHAGRYYICHPLTPRGNRLEYAWFHELLSCASVCKDWDAKWFAQLMLNGLPEPISNFKMECLFLLRKSDGTMNRLVRLENVNGEVSDGSLTGGLEILEAIPFSSPEKFRGWGLGRGNFAFGGNQTQLQMMHEDVCNSTNGRIIEQIDSCGWYFQERGVPGERGHPWLKGIWFSDDCAVAPNGDVLMPDEYGICWLGERGFLLNRKGRESQFLQGRPKMNPHLTILNCGIEYTGWTSVPQGETDMDHLRAFYREVCQRFYEAIGGYDAWLAMGSVFAYFAAPEIFDIHGLFPGLWVHGQMESGKTKTVEWLSALQGFNLTAGIGIIQSATPVGMLQEAENYSNLLVWVDEFREREVEPVKIAILRNAFNRQMQAKWSPDGTQRVIKTAFLVSGESTCSDAAVRSRYVHIQISASKRMANHLKWFNQNKRHFYLIGRALLGRRETFVQHTLHFLDQWLNSPNVAGLNDREKIVHGIAYAAWMGVCALFESHGPVDVSAFKQFVIAHVKAAAEDVTDETNVNAFWQLVITAFKAGAIPKSCFKLASEPAEYPPDMPGMGHWNSHTLYFDPGALLSCLNIFLGKQQGQVVLKRNDLRDQMRMQSYFLPLSWKDEQGNKKTLQVRLGRGKDSSNTKVWGINVDKHPDGLQRDAKREEYDKFLMNDSLGDPRKGALFAIIHALQSEQEGGV